MTTPMASTLIVNGICYAVDPYSSRKEKDLIRLDASGRAVRVSAEKVFGSIGKKKRGKKK